jgi:hypothetical protein
MNNNSFLKKIIFALSIVLIVSCDRDFNEVGADIIEDDIHFDMEQYIASAIAYDMPAGVPSSVVQTNNLTVNSLGVYDSPVFGKTTANFVTQVQLGTENPTFENPTIDTVYLYVPYHSNLESVDAQGAGTYTLDSVYGNTQAKLRLRIYRNGYFLRTSDPGSSASAGQKYYSNELSMVDAVKGEVLVDDSNFIFSNKEIERKFINGSGASEVKERLAPGIYYELNKDYIKTLIMEAPAGKLLNNNIFRDYFRGLYFNVEQVGTDGVMAMPKFNEGKIVIHYKVDRVDTDGNPVEGENGETERLSRTLTLNLQGNTVNFFENNYNTAFTSAIGASNQVAGDEKLYVKGGAGSMAFIDILSGADIDFLKAGGNTLINEANLTFYVDQSAMAAAKNEPYRLFLYDVKNKRPLFDYYFDTSTNTVNSKYNKLVHGGILEKSADGKGYRYKIRITNHVNNIIRKDSTNVKLGLVVTESIGLIGNSAIKDPFILDNGVKTQQVSTIPSASVMHPFGTILYGSNIPPGSPDYDKRVKLEIFYTKPN